MVDPAALLSQLRDGRAGDPAFRHVLADALLEVGDPRGALIAAELALAARRRADERRAVALAMAPCIDRVRAAVPGATAATLRCGLVSAIAIDPTQAPPPSFFADEPLAVVRWAEVPEDPAEAAAAGRAIRGARGLRLRLDPERLASGLAAIDAAAPAVLDLELANVSLDGAPDWPFVHALRVRFVSRSDHRRMRQALARVRQVRALALDPEAGEDWVARLVDLPALAAVDLRAMEVSDRELAELRGRTSVHIRHPSVGLAAQAALDDPLSLDEPVGFDVPSTRRRVTAAPGAGITFATARERKLQVHVRDVPTWQRELPDPVTALAASASSIVVGDEAGRVTEYALDEGTPPVVLASLGAPVTAVATSGDRFAALTANGWWIRGADGEQQGDDAFDALVLAPYGPIRAAGSALTLADGRAIELGDRITAIAVDQAHPSVVYAVAGGIVWRVDDGDVRLVGVPAFPGRLAALGGTVAYGSSAQSAAIRDDRGDRGDRHVQYPSSYQSGGGSLVVADLAVADDGVVLAALDHGGTNLLLPDGSAMKADPFPGEPRLRWIFIYNGEILVAD